VALIDSLIQEGWLKTEKYIEAFKKIKRANFLPDDSRDLAELNEALPIGFGQTISQPLVVAFMLELLEPKEGEKILDIGSGSGWTSALLAEVVGEKGKIISIELIPELKEFGEKNISKYNFIKKRIVEIFSKDGSIGYQEKAPFDKILASASASKLPEEWKTQLKFGGKIVVPILSSIWLFSKNKDDDYSEEEYPGFVFVPLIRKNI
jgi:protein-L-isoaspartate(D-aspartate) O-methyltransferase